MTAASFTPSRDHQRACPSNFNGKTSLKSSPSSLLPLCYPITSSRPSLWLLQTPCCWPWCPSAASFQTLLLLCLPHPRILTGVGFLLAVLASQGLALTWLSIWSLLTPLHVSYSTIKSLLICIDSIPSSTHTFLWKLHSPLSSLPSPSQPSWASYLLCLHSLSFSLLLGRIPNLSPLYLNRLWCTLSPLDCKFL